MYLYIYYKVKPRIVVLTGFFVFLALCFEYVTILSSWVPLVLLYEDAAVSLFLLLC